MLGNLRPHTQGGLEPGWEAASLAHPGPAGQVWPCRPRPPCVWGAQLACQEEPGTICILLTSFLLPPRDLQGQPPSFQLTALREDGPHPHQPSLIYTTAFTPDPSSAEHSSASEETYSSAPSRVRLSSQ